jgi:hypothetical protein
MPRVAGATEFFGVTESLTHVPNENRIAFWASSVAEVNELARLLNGIGAKNIEGPGYEDDSSTYYAVFFGGSRRKSSGGLPPVQELVSS